MVDRTNILDTVDFKHIHSFRTRLRGGDYKGEIKGNCYRPWNTILIHRDLSVFICVCDSWLPIPVGKVLDFNSIEEIINSPKAKILQEDVAERKFTWCAVTHCGVVDKDIPANNLRMSINIDESCNLACPSCRREQIMISNGPEFELKLKSIERILSWLENYDKLINITISGNGDCLASHIMRPIVKTYLPKDNQWFELFTNGLLMKKTLPDSPILKSISTFKISVDAGSAEVYEVVRQPGKWSALIENLDWLDQNRHWLDPLKIHRTNVELTFTVQQKNYRDLPNFIKLCVDRNYTPVITQLDDWATWNSNSLSRENDSFTIKHGTFDENNVLDPLHPEHNDCLEILRHSTTLAPKIDFMQSIKMLINKN